MSATCVREKASGLQCCSGFELPSRAVALSFIYSAVLLRNRSFRVARRKIKSSDVSCRSGFFLPDVTGCMQRLDLAGLCSRLATLGTLEGAIRECEVGLALLKEAET